MAPEAVQARLQKIGAQPVGMHLVGHVGHEQVFRLAHEGLALGAVGQAGLAFVQPVEGGQREAGVVRLVGVRPVGDGQEEPAVGRHGSPAVAPHHELARAGLLQQVGPGGDVELDAQAHGIEGALPQLVEAARRLVAHPGATQHEGAARRRLAPAVAVAVNEAVEVEQRARLRDAVLAHLAAIGGVVARRERHHRRLRRQREPAAHHADVGGAVVGQRHGAPQRNLPGLVAADQRIGEVEEGHLHLGARPELAHDAATLEKWRELAVGHRERRVGARQLEEIVLAVQEGEPARLLLLDDVDLHAVHQRQPAPGQPARDGLRDRLVGRRAVVGDVPVRGRALEIDARRSAPRRQAEGARAHRMRADLAAVVLHHLARHRAEQPGVGEVVDEARVGLAERDAEGVAVDHVHALDHRVVVERRARGQGALAQLGQAGQAGAREDVEVARVPARVEVALERVDVVGRDELARAPLEGRVVGEEDARAQPERELREVGGDLGQRRRSVRHQAHGAREVVEGERRLQDVGDDGVGVQRAVGLRGVEARFGGRKGVAQRALRSGRRPCRRQGGQEAGSGEQLAPVHRFDSSMSTMCHQSCQNTGRR